MRYFYFISLLYSIYCGTYLFEDSQNIHEIKEFDDLNSLITSTTPLIILFYANWCPHCHAFSPIYKDLADAYAASESVLKYAAIDCARHPNFCKVVSFPTYPTLWTWNVDSPDKDGKKIELESRSFSTIRAWLTIRGYGIHTTGPEIPFQLDEGLSDFSLVTLPVQKSRWEEQIIDPKERLQDALTAIELIFSKFIFIANGNDFTEVSVLDTAYVLKILSQSFPVKSVRDNLKSLLDTFLIRLRSLVPGEKFSAGTWSKIMNNKKISSSRAPISIVNYEAKFINCKEVTCGLWTLFHVLQSSTLQEYSDGTIASTPSQIQYTVRTIVSRFFLCHACRLHFLRMFDEEVFNRTKPLIEYSLYQLQQTDIDNASLEIKKLTKSKETMEYYFKFPNSKSIYIKNESDLLEDTSTASTASSVVALPVQTSTYNNIKTAIESIDELSLNYMSLISSNILETSSIWRTISSSNRKKDKEILRERTNTEYWLFNAHNTVSARIASTVLHPINRLTKQEQTLLPKLEYNQFFIRYLSLDPRWPNNKVCMLCRKYETNNNINTVNNLNDIDNHREQNVLASNNNNNNENINDNNNTINENNASTDNNVMLPLPSESEMIFRKKNNLRKRFVSKFVVDKSLVILNFIKKNNLYFVTLDDNGGSLENDIKFSYTEDFIPIHVQKFIRNSYWSDSFTSLIEI